MTGSRARDMSVLFAWSATNVSSWVSGSFGARRALGDNRPSCLSCLRRVGRGNRRGRWRLALRPAEHIRVRRSRSGLVVAPGGFG